VGVVQREASVSPHPSWVCSLVCSFLQVPLPPLASSSQFKVGADKGHDRLGVGVTQEGHKVPWNEFSMGSQGPNKHREGRQTEINNGEGLRGGGRV
jgi:hypothetical protein